MLKSLGKSEALHSCDLRFDFIPTIFFYFSEDYQEFNMVKSMVIRIEDFQKLGRQDLLGKVD